MSLDDNGKFEKARKCKGKINDSQKRSLWVLPAKADSIDVVTVTESACNSAKATAGQWVVVLAELQKVYSAAQAEFEHPENRLKKLIGLKNDNKYRCLVVLKTTPDNLETPKQGTDGYPFTGQGFTCDWYYGDGCRYGLSEFILKKNAKIRYAYEIGNCPVEGLLKGNVTCSQ